MKNVIPSLKKHVLITTTPFLIMGVVFTKTVFAQSLFNPLGKGTTFVSLLNSVVDAVVAIAIPLVGLFIVWAGFLFVTARGSEDKITKAKEVFLWTIVGAAVVLGAKILATVLVNTIKTIG